MLAEGEDAFAASLAEKAYAKRNFASAAATWASRVRPHLRSRLQADRVGATVTYGALHYAVVDAAWRAMGHGYRKQHGMAYDAVVEKVSPPPPAIAMTAAVVGAGLVMTMKK